MLLNSEKFHKNLEQLLQKFRLLWPLNSIYVFTFKNKLFNVCYVDEKGAVVYKEPPNVEKPENSFLIFDIGKNGSNTVTETISDFGLNTLFCEQTAAKEPLLIGLVFPGASEKENEVSLICHSILSLYNQNFFDEKLQKSTERSKQVMSEVSVMHEISRAFEGSNSLDNLLHYIVEKSKFLMRTESASLMLHVAETDELEFKVVLGPKSEEVKPFRLPVGKGISGWVAHNRKPILIPDAYKDERFDPTFDKRSGYRTRSILCVPMVHKNKMVGVMTVLNRLDNQPFSEDDKNLMLTFASQAALAIENARLLISALEKERLDKELQVASEIQNLLLPQEIPQIPGLDISATYLPCKEVSGDFYDIIKLDEHRSAFIVADVAGKGIPAAMLVSTMQATLSAYLEGSLDLISIVDKLNLSIIKKSTEDRFITFFICIYDSRFSTITYLNAGHNPPILVRNNKLIHLRTGGLFLGYTPWQYESETIELKENDILTLYTDGLVEAMNEAHEEYSDERLEQVILNNQNNPTHLILKNIESDVNKHIKQTKLDDDFTLAVIKKIPQD
ncbi:MAG: GAF domain-containing protein [Calditrichaeota bacterium]|nr:MAG: GAF domain-containing protein [Calditrichota bacterium]MBL1204965.1 GAF domain-containing protein [Calditrichota bacterium]NOG44795.1 SpoIIE family protein phosphatase [Calditrichota bacterium]